MEKKESTLKPEYINFSEFCASKKEFEELIKKSDLKPVSNGAQWIVYKIKDPKKEGQFLAYKKLIEDVTDYEDFYRRLFRELDITNRAKHPCTIELLSFDLSEIDKPVIVCRFYKYGSLSSLIGFSERKFNYEKCDYANWGGMKVNSNGSMEVERGTDYTILLYGIARGVKYLHQLKIFHRDLKPENIVIDEKHRPHIADFGLSKITSDDQEQSRTAGTPIYHAPEVDSLDFSFPADIYALGLIFYMLTELRFFLPQGKAKSIHKPLKLYRSKLLRGIGLNLKMRSSNKLSSLINDMVLFNPEQRPKIDYVCKYLEDKDHWFPNTKPEIFDTYKEEINKYENAQFSLIKGDNVFSTDESSSITSKINTLKKTDQIDTKQPIFNDSKYKDIQILLKICSESNNEAECALGTKFYTGYLGIPKDYVAALHYFKEAKKNGNLQADSFLINILNEIVENEKQIYNKDFIKLVNKIEDENDPIFNKIQSKRSQLLYGMIKESDDKYQEAINLYIKSSQKGCNEAKSRLGSLLLKKNIHLELSEKLLEETSQWKRKKESCKIKYYIDDNERKLSLLNLGLLKKQKGNFDESIEIFEELLKEDHPDAALLIGICYEKKGDLEKAKEYYTKSYNEFSNISAKQLLNYLTPPPKKK